MTVWLSLFVALVGLLIYGFGKDKIVEVGRIMFFAGLLAFLLQSAQVVAFLNHR